MMLCAKEKIQYSDIGDNFDLTSDKDKMEFQAIVDDINTKMNFKDKFKLKIEDFQNCPEKKNIAKLIMNALL